MACADIPADVRPSFLECTACSKKHEVRLMNTCDCGAPLFARYDWKDLAVQDLASRRDLWRYAPLLPLEETTIRSRGEGGTPLYKLESIGTGGRVARLRVAGLYVKDEGLNPTRTFKARGMAVAVPVASSLGATPLGVPDWILFPSGGGTGVAGMWKALQELRELGWYEGPWPRFGVVQAEGCAPLVKAWKDGRETAELWPNPRTDAAGLRVPGTLADRIVLRALRETRGAAVAVTEAAMKVASQNLAVLEGISACLEGAATLAGLRRLYDEGTITRDDRVVLLNTGAADSATVPRPSVPTIRTAADARSYLGLTPRAP